MARPQKKEAERLTHRLPHIRCTAGEYASALNRSERAGMTLSEFARDMLLNGSVKVTRERRLDFATAEELRRIGVNLNQQTKKLNATGVMPIELRRVWAKLETILDDILIHA